MSVVSINLGIDFGTHQSKVCVQIQEETSKRFEFVPLDRSVTSIDSVLLPSLIHVFQDGRFDIGPSPQESCRTYSFFKIASAEDEEFHVDLATAANRYSKDEFLPYHPEQLSIIYVAGMILKVRDHISDTISVFPVDADVDSGFGELLQTQDADSELEWRYRMGVPTEYHSSANLKRKRKFEQILMMAIILADSCGNSFWSSTITEVTESLERLHKEILEELGFNSDKAVGVEAWKAFLAENRVSVFPETAAGLMFLVKTNKLETDRYYMAMDIGGGSTDISFFKAEYNGTFTYLASQSVMLAANDVALDMGVKRDLLHVRESVNSLYNTPGIERTSAYFESFNKLGKGLNKASLRMFNGQVWSRVEYSAADLYKDSQCYLYGGGSMLPESEPNPEKYMKRVELHNNGTSDNLTVPVLYIEVTPIENLTITEEVVNPGWKAQMRVLIVSLGLSLSMPDDHMVDYVIENFSKPVKDGSEFSDMFDFPTADWV